MLLFGTGRWYHPQLGVNGGKFTKYPTQARSYFLWSIITDVMHLLFSGKSTTISIFNI